MEKIFVSFKGDDSDHREGFEGTLTNENFSYEYAPISSREDVRVKGEDAVKAYLSDLIKECDALICLIGDNTFQSEWVGWELDVASSLNIGIGAIKVNDNDVQIPGMITSKRINVRNWSGDDIKKSISRALRFTMNNK